MPQHQALSRRPVGRRRAPARAALGVAAGLTAAGCGNPAATSTAQPQSDSNALSSGIASLLPNLLSPSTITEIINALKSSDVIAALKKAWGSGVCKTEISALTQAGLGLFTQNGINAIKGFFGGQNTLDLTNIQTAFSNVSACFEKAAPDILKTFEGALTSSISSSKVVDPNLLVIAPEQIQALDTNSWLAEPAAEEAAGAGEQPASVPPPTPTPAAPEPVGSTQEAGGDAAAPAADTAAP